MKLIFVWGKKRFGMSVYSMLIAYRLYANQVLTSGARRPINGRP